MSFSDTLTLKNAAAANVTMARLTDDQSKSTYMDITSSLSTPRQLMIAHQMATSPSGTDRHLTKFTKTVLDTNLKPQTAIINISCSVPRLGIARGDLDDLIAMFKEFYLTANVDKLFRGEV